MEFQLFVEDGEALTQAHIHCGAAVANGPVAAFLACLHPGMDVDGKWVSNTIITDRSIVPNSGCGNTVAALAQSMRSGGTYVNVHSVAFPGGVIRGQITP